MGSIAPTLVGGCDQIALEKVKDPPTRGSRGVLLLDAWDRREPSPLRPAWSYSSKLWLVYPD